jgi:signal peptidase complex subunit 2
MLTRYISQILTRASPAGEPFKASHIHTDVRLVLGFTAAIIMISVFAWSYFVEKEWEANKTVCAYAVGAYMLLSAGQMASSHIQGDVIFDGIRRSEKGGKSETLQVKSPQKVPKAKYLPADSVEAKTLRLLPGTSLSSSAEKSSTGVPRPVCIPPQYSLAFSYTSTTSDGKRLVKESGSGTGPMNGKKRTTADDAIPLGHFGEWFTEEGEFRQDVFEERLRGALNKVIG